MYTVEEYDFFKSKGICVGCRKEKAVKGRVRCRECLKKDVDRKRPYKLDEETKNRMRLHNKRKKGLCVAFGVCVNCMQKDAKKGQICIECWLKRQRIYKEKREEVARIERYEYELCYFCGDKVVEGKRVCSKHLEQCQINMENARSLRSKENFFTIQT